MSESKLRYHVCAYKNCTNSRSNSPGLSFYVFPVKDIERCKKWIRNSGNVHLIQNIDNPDIAKRKVICAEHFTDKCFRDVKACPKKLIHSAVPLNCSSTGE